MLPAGSSHSARCTGYRNWRMRMTCPGSGTGTMTTDAEWRTTSTVTSRPLGMRTRSRSTLKTLPLKTRWLSSTSWSDMVVRFSRLLVRHDIIQHLLEVRRQGGFELQTFPVRRVGEAQSSGVQEGALEAQHGPQVGGNAAAHAAVHRVADDRVADRAQVHADLVRAAGRDGDLQQRDPLQVAGGGDARHGVPRAPRPRGHLLTVAWIAPDGLVDPAPRLHDAPDERDVLLLHLAIVELARELLVRAIVLGDDHEPGRAAVEAVDDPRPQFPADPAEVRDVVQQGVHERAAVMSRGGMDDHPRGLVEHHQVRILVNDAERQRLRERRRGGRRRNLDRERLPRADGRARAKLFPGSADDAVFDQSLDLGPREVRYQGGQEVVEAEAVVFLLDHDLPARGRGRPVHALRYAARARLLADVGSGCRRRARYSSMMTLSGMMSRETNWEV